MRGYKEFDRKYLAVYKVIGSEIPEKSYRHRDFHAKNDEQALRKAKKLRRDVIKHNYVKSADLIRLVESVEFHREIPLR